MEKALISQGFFGGHLYCCPFMANDSNFDRNPLRGCNYGSEGGAVPDLGGATTALGGALLYPWGQQ